MGELADIIGGGTPSTLNLDYWDGNIDWYSPAEIIDQIYVDRSQRKITELGFENSSAKMLPEGTVLFTSRAGIGKTAILAKKGCTNQGFQSIVPYSNKLDSYFIFSRTEELKKYGELVGAGSTFVEVSGRQMENMQLMIPKTIGEQHIIGVLFSTFDHLITLHQSKSFEHIFKAIVNCTLYWEQRKLGEIAERIIRKNEKLESTLPLTISAQYGLIDQNEFFDKRIASKDVRGYYLIKKGEFAYNKSTSVDAPFGAIKRLDKYNNGVLSTLYILFKIIDDTSTGSDYLVTYYATDLWHRGIQSIAAEGARNHGLLNIAPNDFFETMLSIPLNISEQKKVGDFFISLDHLITLHQLEPYKLIFKAIAYRIIDYAKSKPLSSIK